MCILLMKRNNYISVYGTGTRPEKVLTKNICRVHDFKDRILCPRTMATYAFFAKTFFSD